MSLSHRRRLRQESTKTEELNLDVPVPPPVTMGYIICYCVVLACWILPAECLEITGIELVSRPLAFNGCRRLPALRVNEVYLMPTFVAPVSNCPGLNHSLNLVQDEMLPELPHVSLTQVLPAAMAAYKTSVETIDLWSCHYLCRPVFREGSDYMSNKCCF